MLGSFHAMKLSAAIVAGIGAPSVGCPLPCAITFTEAVTNEPQRQDRTGDRLDRRAGAAGGSPIGRSGRSCLDSWRQQPQRRTSIEQIETDWPRLPLTQEPLN